jgi:tagaturonate reductase
MRHRYDLFAGDPGKGFLLFPCELIEKNGDTLKHVLLALAQSWYPDDPGFLNWLETANIFFNTLVDRIVSGYPREEAEALCRTFGYEDRLIDTGEIFHFLVIEGPSDYEREFPLIQAGLNVKWCDDLTPYRTRKVRILNGAHTMTVLLAHLYGLETVKECMDDERIANYIRRGIFDEIIPTLDLPDDELADYGRAVLERFSNPFIRHLLLSISLNSVSKFKTRVLPSLLEYQARQESLPTLLTLSLAGLVLFYRVGDADPRHSTASRALDGAAYTVNDDQEVLDFFASVWKAEDGLTVESCIRLMMRVLSHTESWGQDLSAVDGLVDKTADYLHRLIGDGVKPTLKSVMEVA